MEPVASPVERLVLLAAERPVDGAPDEWTGQTVDAIARRSGIKHHEVARVLSRLETSNPPLARRRVEEGGAELWQLVDADPQTVPAKAGAQAAT